MKSDAEFLASIREKEKIAVLKRKKELKNNLAIAICLAVFVAVGSITVPRVISVGADSFTGKDANFAPESADGIYDYKGDADENNISDSDNSDSVLEPESPDYDFPAEPEEPYLISHNFTYNGTDYQLTLPGRYELFTDADGKTDIFCDGKLLCSTQEIVKGASDEIYLSEENSLGVCVYKSDTHSVYLIKLGELTLHFSDDCDAVRLSEIMMGLSNKK